MILKPFPNRVIVRPVMPDGKIGSIHVPEIVQGRIRPTRGIVLAAHRYIEDLSAGDTVFWPKYAGTLNTANENDPVMFLNSDEILGSVSAPDAEVEDGGRPRPWHIWVDLPEHKHQTSLVLPDNFRPTKISILGTIRALGNGFNNDVLKVGTKIVLAQVPTRRIPLREDSDETTFAIRREHVLGYFPEASDAPTSLWAGDSYELGRYPADTPPEALVEALRATPGGLTTDRED